MRPMARIAYLGAMITTGLVAGVFLSEYLGISPVLRALPAGDYLRMKQAIIRAYNPAMPILGIGGSILYVAWLVMMWKARLSSSFRYGALGFALLVASTATTIIGELPANERILAMRAEEPPPDWEALRQSTMTVIDVRTLLMVLAFVCLTVGSSHPLPAED